MMPEDEPQEFSPEADAGATGQDVTGDAPGPVDRVQLGVRIEKRMAKVLKAVAEYQDKSLGELLESIVLHAFEGARAFTDETLQTIAELKKVYGMEYDLSASPRLAEGGGTWDRYTKRARRVVFFAQEEAARLGKHDVDTAHLLLGLVREDDSAAAKVLARLRVPLKSIRAELERHLTRGPGLKGKDMQLTPRSKQAINLAYGEARQLNDNYIGSEHLLLGLIREEESRQQAAEERSESARPDSDFNDLGGKVLITLGADLERTRRAIRALREES